MVLSGLDPNRFVPLEVRGIDPESRKETLILVRKYCLLAMKSCSRDISESGSLPEITQMILLYTDCRRQLVEVDLELRVIQAKYN